MTTRQREKSHLRLVNEEVAEVEGLKRQVALLLASDPMVASTAHVVRVGAESDELALRRTIRGFCDALGIEITDDRSTELNRADLHELEAIRGRIVRTGRW